MRVILQGPGRPIVSSSGASYRRGERSGHDSIFAHGVVARLSSARLPQASGSFWRLSPHGWSRYELTYRHHSATNHIVAENAAGTGRGVRAVTVRACRARWRDPAHGRRKNHEVRVELGWATA